MGSLVEVMRKIDEQAPAELPGPAPDSAALEPPPNTAAAPGAAPAESAAAASRFAAAAPDAHLDGCTVAWHPARVDPAIVAFHERFAPVCEQFRAVRARLLSMNTSGAHQVIALTSSVPQEGKSVSLLNLGLVMAEGGEHRTLLADADFRRAALARMLGLSAGPGLAELIRREATWPEVLTPSPYPNLKLLLPGKLSGETLADVLGATSTREVIASLRRSFDYTFLDMPPVNTVSDVSMLAPHCDGVILVIEMHRTPEPTVQRAVRTLQANNVKILGCLLTRHDDRRTHYYDRYSYYYRPS